MSCHDTSSGDSDTVSCRHLLVSHTLAALTPLPLPAHGMQAEPCDLEVDQVGRWQELVQECEHNPGAGGAGAMSWGRRGWMSLS